MPMVATMKPYTLFVVDDDMPLNPRTDYDNLGKIVCWHSRYDLGDKHDFDEPRDFLQRKLFDMYSSYPSSQYGKPVYEFINQAKPKPQDWNMTDLHTNGCCMKNGLAVTNGASHHLTLLRLKERMCLIGFWTIACQLFRSLFGFGG